MDSLLLTREVKIVGPDFWGRSGEITFSPSKCEWKGWRWKNGASEPNFIFAQMLHHRARRTCLQGEKGEMNVFEHVGALRFFGLSQVTIASPKWPPHFGRGWELWQALSPHCERSRVDVPLYGVRRAVRGSYERPRGGYEAFTEIKPPTGPVLRLDITICYPGLGPTSATFEFPDERLLVKVIQAKSQGWPPWLYYPARGAAVLGWPHLDKSAWPESDKGGARVLDEFLLHRAHDLLGGLSVLCRDGYFVGDVVSVCSGHKADVEAIWRAAENIDRYR